MEITYVVSQSKIKIRRKKNCRASGLAFIIIKYNVPSPFLLKYNHLDHQSSEFLVKR